VKSTAEDLPPSGPDAETTCAHATSADVVKSEMHTGEVSMLSSSGADLLDQSITHAAAFSLGAPILCWIQALVLQCLTRCPNALSPGSSIDGSHRCG